MKKITFFLAMMICLQIGSVNAEPFVTDVSSLPMNYAFDRVYGNGERQISIFCDLDCPHCQRTENLLPQLRNVTVHTFVFPVASYHPDAPRKTNAIWCSTDKISAWNEWFATRNLPNDAQNCQAPLEEINNYAHMHNIFLPAVIFEDGQTYHAEDFIYATQTSDRLNGLIDEHSEK